MPRLDKGDAYHFRLVLLHTMRVSIDIEADVLATGGIEKTEIEAKMRALADDFLAGAGADQAKAAIAQLTPAITVEYEMAGLSQPRIKGTFNTENTS